jgi:SAM-dependent methyltransferase
MVPVEVRSAARYGLGLARDVTDRVKGETDKALPPHRLRFVGNGDFKAIGEDVLRELIELGGLQPTDAVLDIGCGIGRIAIPLIGYLSDGGRYSGFDIVPKAITWCTSHITKVHPEFTFTLVDLGNTLYRKSEKSDAGSFRFPYADGSFDFAFATSLYTHLMPNSMANYVAEMGRVLKPGGTSFTTWFLLNDEIRGRLKHRLAPLNFPWDYGSYAVDNKRVPEAATAYDEALVRETFSHAGLQIQEPINFSSWNGGPFPRPGQDIIIATKE